MSTWQNRNTTGRQQASNSTSNIDGIVNEIIGDQAAQLQWEQTIGECEIIPGGTNYSILSDFRGSILRLWKDFFQGSNSIKCDSQTKQLLQKRLMLLEHEADGLLKRRINFSVKDSQGGERFLDYTGLLNEKENQIVQLEKKIQNLQQRLRRASKRQSELEGEIERLREALKRMEKPGVSRADIEGILRASSDYSKLQQKYNGLLSRFEGFGSILKTHVDKLRGSGIKFEYQNELNSLMRGHGLSASIVNGVVNVCDFKDRVIEVPVSDARTKHLIHMLAVQMKKYFEKYPKLREQCDARLAEFFQQQIIDLIEVDEIDRVVEIVKFVPDVVKVQNVYAYSSQKSRKVEFHLRVLIKALLEELEKVKARTGVALEIDEGIVGMIRAEIMDVVNVDDILKVFRVVPKIVQVEKVVQKIVDRVIEIPQVVPVEKIVEKIIEVPKIQQVEKIIHVPVEIIKLVEVEIQKIVEVVREHEKIVEVPRIIEKVVEKIIEIPKVITQEIIVEKVIEVEKPTIVQKIINVPVPEIQRVQVIVEKPVTVQKIVQRVVPVEIYVDKIVTETRFEPQLVPVQIRKDVLVKQIQVQNAREVVNHIQKVPEIVETIIEKPVQMIRTIEKIVEVPKIIEKIVQVKVEVPVIKEVKVIEEKIVYQDRIKQVQRIVNHQVEKIKQVEKIVQKRIQVPIVQERIIRVPEMITQIVVEKIEVPVIQVVDRHVEKIVEMPKIVQVEKPTTVYVNVDNPVKIMVEKIVQVPKTIERIKEVRVNIDKIIEKMVEVPKVVQVEKIVEKVVVVPRVIQKIVEVPQIVEKCVDRIIENTVIQEVQRCVQVPVYQDRIKEIQVPVNTYITQPQIVDREVEKIVEVVRVQQKVEVVKEESEKVVQARVQVPREILVDRIVPIVHEVTKFFEVEKPVVVPVEVPVPVDRVIEKVVHVNQIEERIVEAIRQVEKVVQVRYEDIRVEKLVEVREKAVIETQFKEIEKVVPYVQNEIQKVELITEKPVINNIQVQKIIEVPTYIEKLVPETHQVIKMIDVETRVDNVIEVPKIVTVENVIPVLVECNQIVQEFRDRPIEIPLIHKEIEEIKCLQEKVVAIENYREQIKEVECFRDRIVEQQKLVIKENICNQIQGQVQVVDRFEEKIVPVCSTIEKIIEIPYVLEKIVEKIVVMPQIVQVLKYVHEIVEEETLGVACDVTVQQQQLKYKQLYGNIKGQFDIILAELRKLRTTNPGLRAQIDLIDSFLVELNRLIAFPKIVQVEKEKIVEVDKNIPVLVPKFDSEAERLTCTMGMIISKLLGELLRITEKNPSVKSGIDAQLLKLFSSQFQQKEGLLRFDQGSLQQNLDKIYKFYDNFLGSLGGSDVSKDQQLMYTAALEQRLLVASLMEEANLQISKAKQICEKRSEAFRLIQQSQSQLLKDFQSLQGRILSMNGGDNIKDILGEFEGRINGGLTIISNIEPIRGLNTIGSEIVFEHHIGNLTDFALIDENGHRTHYGSTDANNIGSSILSSIYGGFDNNVFVRLESAFRAIQKENQLLRDKYIRWQTQRPNVHGVEDRDKIIDTLQKKIVELSSQINQYQMQGSVSVNVTGDAQDYENKIRTLNNRIIDLESQLRNQRQTQSISQTSSSDANIKEYEIKIRTLNSRIQQLQSQNRTVKVEFEGKIREKDRIIHDLEKKVMQLQEKIKIGDSRVTGVSQPQYTASNSAQQRMSSSMASNSSSEGQPSSGSGRTYSNYQSASGSSSYKPSGTSSGITYGSQQPGTSGSTYSSQQQGTSGSTYGQSGTNYGQSGSTYTSGNLSGSGAGSGARYSSTAGGATSGSSYGTSGTGYTQGTTYGTSSGAGSGAGGVSYGQSSSGYSRTYGTTGTGATGSSSGTGSTTRYYGSSRGGEQK